MKQAKSALVQVSILAVLFIWGFIALYRAGYLPGGLDVFIFAMILISGIYAFVTHMKKYKDEKQGFPAEDELSTRIKYKAGYYGLIFSLYIWLFIFLFNRYFPDVETMLGAGILLSAVVSMAIKGYLTRNYHENEN
jgi:hypothetical protein